jgi:hypothetical protein
MVRYTGAYLGLARSQRPRLVLAPEAPRVLAPRDLSQICNHEPLHICNAWGANSDKMHAYAQFTQTNLFNHLLIYP